MLHVEYKAVKSLTINAFFAALHHAVQDILMSEQ